MKKNYVLILTVMLFMFISACSGRKKGFPIWVLALIQQGKAETAEKKPESNTSAPVSGTAPVAEQTAPLCTLGGSLTGLMLGGHLIIKEGQEELELTANGAFVFPTQKNSGAAYAINVFQNPLNQSCSVSNGSGVFSSASVSDVNIVCNHDYLTVQTVSPAKNSLDNSINTAVIFQMNKDLDCAQSPVSSFACNGYNVSFASSCSGRTVSLVPNVNLPYFTLCSVSLNSAFALNSTLQSPYSFSFKTTDKMPYAGIRSLEYSAYQPPAYISSTLNPLAGFYMAAVKNGSSAYYFFREPDHPYALRGGDYTNGQVTTTTTMLFLEMGLDPLKKIDIYVKNSSSAYYSCYSGGAVQFLDEAQNILESIPLSPCRGVGFMSGYSVPSGTIFLRLVSSDWATAVRIVNQGPN